MEKHGLRDVTITIERTGAHHRPVQRALATGGFDVRIVHHLTTKQFRAPADPGNKTDDTDLCTIHRVAANGFGLRENGCDEAYGELNLLVRSRRDLVRKDATLRNQLHAELDNFLPGFSAAIVNVFDDEPALEIAGQLHSAQEIVDRGVHGLARLLEGAGVRYQHLSLAKILPWA
jgi:transposase